LKNILIVDDEKSVLDTLEIILRDIANIYICQDIEKANEILETITIDFLIIDYKLEQHNGIKYYKEDIIPKYGNLPAILISALKEQPRNKHESNELKLFLRIIEKPFDALILKSFIFNYLNEGIE
jgi:DNA-binding NtrC family response regulator